MRITTDWICHDGRLGYLAWPERAATPLPAVLVIQEIWGVDAHIQDDTVRLASAGYAAFALDLYATNGRRPESMTVERIAEVQAFMNTLPRTTWTNPAERDVELAKLSEPLRTRINETHKALFAGIESLDRFVPPLVATTCYLRQSCPVSRGQKVACVGFCMGGGLSALLACNDPELSGAAVFYGNAPPADLVPRIACPVIGFYGGLDQRINAGIPAFAEAMRAAGKRFEHRIYEGAPHAFFNDTRPSYEVRAARASFARLLEFLQGTTGT
jgi:carboxymethylenebutenolidase